MLPAEPVLRAARRWLVLLGHSSHAEAAAIIGADSSFSDLTFTHYGVALEWLADLSLVDRSQSGYRLGARLALLRDGEHTLLLFSQAIESAAPPWLQDADVLVRTTDDLPQDALTLASALDIELGTALGAIRQVHGRVDLQRRAEVGAQGERCVLRALERAFPGSTTHISIDHDGFGYDIAYRDPTGIEWHLEVKSTTRRGRLVIHLSRQEYEIARRDPTWRLLIAGLDEPETLACLAQADVKQLLPRAPQDKPNGAEWESARFMLSQNDLVPGIRFAGEPPIGCSERLVFMRGSVEPSPLFAWMPRSEEVLADD